MYHICLKVGQRFVSDVPAKRKGVDKAELNHGSMVMTRKCCWM